MKTHVIPLESHDDYISACDKMGWSKAPRVVLIWPGNSENILNRKLDLILLLRHSFILGIQLALVTHNSDVVASASNLGIPVFSSAKKAQRVPWRRPRFRRRRFNQKNKPIPDFYTKSNKLNTSFTQFQTLSNWQRIIVFCCGIFSILTLILFFWPGAQVVIDSMKETQELTLQVWASPGISSPVISGGLPAETVSIVVEGQDTIESINVLKVPGERATGFVQITNLTDRPVLLSSGSVIVSTSKPPVRFQTLFSTTIPPGADTRTEVEIQALNGGSEGNLPGGQLTAFEGALGLKLAVNNTKPTQGGVDELSKSPSKEDYQSLKERLLASLRQTARSEVINLMQPGQEFVPASLIIKRILSETTQPAVGQPGDQLKLTLRVEYQGWLIRSDHLGGIVKAALDANLPPNYGVIKDKLTIKEIGQPRIEENIGYWEINVSRQISKIWTTDTILSWIRGQEVSSARRILKTQMGLDELPVIISSPSWWPLIPFASIRIQVVME